MVIWNREDYLKEARLIGNLAKRFIGMLTMLEHAFFTNKIFQSNLKRNTYQKKNLNTLLTIRKMLLT